MRCVPLCGAGDKAPWWQHEALCPARKRLLGIWKTTGHPPHQVVIGAEQQRLPEEPIKAMVENHIARCPECIDWMRLHETDDYHHWLYYYPHQVDGGA